MWPSVILSPQTLKVSFFTRWGQSKGQVPFCWSFFGTNAGKQHISDNSMTCGTWLQCISVHPNHISCETLKTVKKTSTIFVFIKKPTKWMAIKWDDRILLWVIQLIIKWGWWFVGLHQFVILTSSGTTAVLAGGGTKVLLGGSSALVQDPGLETGVPSYPRVQMERPTPVKTLPSHRTTYPELHSIKMMIWEVNKYFLFTHRCSLV